MGLLKSLRKIGSVALAPVTGGMSLGAGGEDLLSKIPVVNSLTGATSDEQRALEKKQKEMAREAALQAERQRRQQLQSTSQQLMAFGPRNQMMAQVYGPEAAFTGQQMAQLAADPGGAPQHSDPRMQKLYEQGLLDRPYEQQLRMMGDAGLKLDGPDSNRARLQDAAAHADKVAAWKAQEAARRAQIEAAFGTPQGPAPIAPTRAAPARRY
jgi:hypothetical protein